MFNLNARLLFALLMALILTILPLPEIVSEFRHPWILLLVLAVQFFFPKYFHLSLVFVLGFCLDVLLTRVAGEHAFALLLTTWVASSKVRRFRFFSIGQQMALVGLFCLMYQGIFFLIDAFLRYHPHPVAIIGAGLSGLLFWPWVLLLVYGALRTSQNRYDY